MNIFSSKNAFGKFSKGKALEERSQGISFHFSDDQCFRFERIIEAESCEFPTLEGGLFPLLQFLSQALFHAFQVVVYTLQRPILGKEGASCLVSHSLDPRDIVDSVADHGKIVCHRAGGETVLFGEALRVVKAELADALDRAHDREIRRQNLEYVLVRGKYDHPEPFPGRKTRC